MAHEHSAHGHAGPPGSSGPPDYKADARAAFMGLIFGAFALLAICYTIVQLTANKFEGHAAAPAAGQTAPH